MGATGRHDVVITGLGPVTPIGTGIDRFWSAVLEGRCGGRALDGDRFREFRCRVGAPVEDPPLACSRVTEREAMLLDPLTRLALAAAALAIDDAGLRVAPDGDRRTSWTVGDIDPARVGVIVGTGIGGITSLERSHTLYARGERLRGAIRYAVPMLIPNALPAQIAIKYGLHGECKAVASACASGTMAIGDAFRLLREGELDACIAGGAERVLSTPEAYGFMGFDVLGTMTTRNDDPSGASRPFDVDRDGFLMGEGAAMLVLEREDHARARGARIRARVLGYGSTCDAHSMMQLHPDGTAMVRCMESAMRSAGVTAADVGYVNAHGTATRQNDPQECRAVRAVLGRRADDVPVNSTKAMTGHGIAASGAIEAVVTAMSLESGRIHRCVNLDRPDPDCDVFLPRENLRLRPVSALTNSFGFGGHNSTLVVAPA